MCFFRNTAARVRDVFRTLTNNCGNFTKIVNGKAFCKMLHHRYFQGPKYVAGSYSAEWFYRKTPKYSQWNICGEVFLAKLWYVTWKPTKKEMLQSLEVFWKETLTQVFSCDICKIFKNTYFEEHSPIFMKTSNNTCIANNWGHFQQR